MRLLIILFILSYQFACSTFHRDPSTAQSWVGSNITALTQKWGHADTIINTPGGNSFYVYTSKTKYHLPDTNPGVVRVRSPGGRTVGVAIPPNCPEYQVVKCKLMFQVNRRGIITKYRSQGKDCDAVLQTHEL